MSSPAKLRILFLEGWQYMLLEKGASDDAVVWMVVLIETLAMVHHVVPFAKLMGDMCRVSSKVL